MQPKSHCHIRRVSDEYHNVNVIVHNTNQHIKSDHRHVIVLICCVQKHTKSSSYLLFGVYLQHFPTMSKLTEWLLVLNLLVAIYIMLIMNPLKSSIINEWMFEIQISPIILIAAFGVSLELVILLSITCVQNQ